MNSISQNSIKKVIQAIAELDAPMLANEAAIYLKTAMLCETRGIREAMKYFLGFHSEGEFEEIVEAKELVINTHGAIVDFLSRIEDIQLRSTGGKKVKAGKVGRPKKSAE